MNRECFQILDLREVDLMQVSVFVLKGPGGLQLAYNPDEGLIFFRNVADGVTLSERLGFPTSERRFPSPSRVFSLDEMREHYKDRLREGFAPLGEAEVHFISNGTPVKTVEVPDDFEYGLTDT
jgi:hypothetical protein